jgi:Icc-related predicted phosphoesterase
MKIVCISDTHTHELQMTHPVPDGDVLVFAGDMSYHGELNKIMYFNQWLGTLPHAHKIVIAGNHDRSFEDHRRFEARTLLTNCTYLEDQETIIEGVKFYGSPVQPWFYDWAFNKRRGEEIKKYWDAIPDDTNVLITHGPVFGILDKVIPGNEYVGCKDLKKRIETLPDLKLHVCGHIHCGHGRRKIRGVTYVNASICDEDYSPIQKPIVVEI